MDFLPEELKQKLLHNGAPENRDKDHAPVVRLYLPGTVCEWLLSELEPDDNPDIAFGLCDLGLGFPELGSVSLSELASIRFSFQSVKRETTFQAEYPMSVYARAARYAQEITTNSDTLRQAAADLHRERRSSPQPE